eukprot:Protomagalhaensia_sp_Gyna_25__2648@NODE_250_length_4185_cov_11_664255_g192_i0_p1_GENE_NODE_250_length_4185_cov_11_664255_g192_i0NODE_250_length_4185_cov_11_664255_g192_i0_p1_ORF_typecomplete_len657_score113_06_NODE_250_length_4185_cov_11_664255_g192_i04022372
MMAWRRMFVRDPFLIALLERFWSGQLRWKMTQLNRGLRALLLNPGREAKAMIECLEVCYGHWNVQRHLRLFRSHPASRPSDDLMGRYWTQLLAILEWESQQLVTVQRRQQFCYRPRRSPSSLTVASAEDEGKSEGCDVDYAVVEHGCRHFSAEYVMDAAINYGRNRALLLENSRSTTGGGCLLSVYSYSFDEKEEQDSLQIQEENNAPCSSKRLSQPVRRFLLSNTQELCTLKSERSDVASFLLAIETASVPAQYPPQLSLTPFLVKAILATSPTLLAQLTDRHNADVTPRKFLEKVQALIAPTRDPALNQTDHIGFDPSASIKWMLQVDWQSSQSSSFWMTEPPKKLWSIAPSSINTDTHSTYSDQFIHSSIPPHANSLPSTNLMPVETQHPGESVEGSTSEAKRLTSMMMTTHPHKLKGRRGRSCALPRADGSRAKVPAPGHIGGCNGSKATTNMEQARLYFTAHTQELMRATMKAFETMKLKLQRSLIYQAMKSGVLKPLRYLSPLEEMFLINAVLEETTTDCIMPLQRFSNHLHLHRIQTGLLQIGDLHTIAPATIGMDVRLHSSSSSSDYHQCCHQHQHRCCFSKAKDCRSPANSVLRLAEEEEEVRRDEEECFVKLVFKRLFRRSDAPAVQSVAYVGEGGLICLSFNAST